MEIMASNIMISWQTDWGKVKTMADFILLYSKIIADCDCSHEIKRRLLLGIKAMRNLDSILNIRDITLLKGLHNQAVFFSNSHVQMWELDHKEGWALENWYFWIVVLEKTLESPLDCKNIKPVNPKGNQLWMMLQPKHQYFGQLIWIANSLEKILMLGKSEARKLIPCIIVLKSKNIQAG